MKPTLQDTVSLMMLMHHGQTDKAGHPYFMHPLRVMFRLGSHATNIEKQAALLHDVIEDTPLPLASLVEMGYDPAVIEIVRLMTREKPLTYNEYIDRLIASGNVGAMRVKMADSADNSCWSRCSYLSEEEQGLVQRYSLTGLKLNRELHKYGLADSVIRGDLAL